MNILYVWSDNYPWDIRVEKICTALINAGHKVHLLAANKNGGPKTENLNNLFIHRLPFIKINLINKVINFPIFLNPLWLLYIFYLTRSKSINLVISRDLPLALSSIISCKLNKIPVFFDMAEVYPEMFRSRYNFLGRKSLINKIIRNVYIAEKVQKISVKYSDKILVVVPEVIKRISPDLKYQKKIIVISNTPDLRSYFEDDMRMCNKYTDIYKNKFVIVYHGGTTKIRGIHIVIAAIEKIKSEVPDLRFVIIGPKEEYLDRIIKEKDLVNFVHLLGWMDIKEIFNFINTCDVGIIPHIRTSHTNHTVPNKLFDYMACGLPIITNNIDPIKRIIKENNCGFVYNDSNELSKILKNVYSKNDLTEYTERAKLAVKNKYNWEFDKKKLIDIIKKIEV